MLNETNPESEIQFLQDEPLKKKLMRNGFRMYFFSFIVAPTGYIIKAIIAREISIEDIGTMYSILSIIGVISAYNDLGLTEALQYYLPHYLIDKEYVKAKTIIVFTWFMQFVSGIIIGFGLYFFAPYIGMKYFSSGEAAVFILRLFCIYFLINNLLQVVQSIFISIQHIKLYHITEVVRMRSILILIFAGSSIGQLNIYTFTYAWFAGLVLAIITAIIGVKKVFWNSLSHVKIRFDRKLLKKQWIYGFRVMLGFSASIILGQVNQLLAQYRFGSTVSGYWTYYLTLYSIVTFFITPLITYLFPLLNELYKKGDLDKVKMLSRYLYIGVAVFGIVAGLVAYFFSEPITVLLFGEKFRFSGSLFMKFAPFIFTVPLIGILYQDIASRGFIKERFYSYILAVCINVLSSRWLVKYYQANGLVYGHIIGNIILVILGLYHYKNINRNAVV